MRNAYHHGVCCQSIDVSGTCVKCTIGDGNISAVKKTSDLLSSGITSARLHQPGQAPVAFASILWHFPRSATAGSSTRARVATDLHAAGGCVACGGFMTMRELRWMSRTTTRCSDRQTRRTREANWSQQGANPMPKRRSLDSWRARRRSDWYHDRRVGWVHCGGNSVDAVHASVALAVGDPCGQYHVHRRAARVSVALSAAAPHSADRSESCG